jgi:hypothetical protein
MHERFAADQLPSGALTTGALPVVLSVAVAISIIGIVIIRPSAGGASD